MIEYAYIGVFAFLGAIFVGGALISSKLLSYRSADVGRKKQPYECSEDLIGSAKIQFHIGYYVFALLFLIFDIESLFLFPCVRIFKKVTEGGFAHIDTMTIFLEVSVFIFVLLFGLIFAWRKGVLEWE